MAAPGSELAPRSREFTVVFGAALLAQMGPLQLFFGFLGTVSAAHSHYFAPSTPRGLSAGDAGDSGRRRLAHGGLFVQGFAGICTVAFLCRDLQGSAGICRDLQGFRVGVPSPQDLCVHA